MLQLGLLRVITWPGSRFKKQKIKAQILFVPTRSSWCSSNLRSVDRALDLVWVFALMLQWWFGYWQFILNRQSFIFCWGFVGPLPLCFCYPSLLPDLFLLWLQSAGCPSFIRLLHRFWLNGLLFYFGNDCLYLWLFGTITVFCFVRNSLVPFVVHLDQLRELPCPRLW